MDVTLTIRRYQPEVRDEPYCEDFDLEADPTDRVLDLLNHIERHIDGQPAPPGDGRPGGRLALSDHPQLPPGLPPGHQGDEGHRRGEEADPLGTPEGEPPAPDGHGRRKAQPRTDLEM